MWPLSSNDDDGNDDIDDNKDDVEDKSR